ncbi:hypothetical protein QWZ10_00925 [Paracoccus cavernae]|uniref:Secreted protein n=1 Tax=Paracoccus cavernae TaxID=1571207 RepID=A0ABT8D5R2_9RHOB|nr:hypothetical protein [Paracoccus cavernae]
MIGFRDAAIGLFDFVLSCSLAQAQGFIWIVGHPGCPFILPVRTMRFVQRMDGRAVSSVTVPLPSLSKACKALPSKQE